MAATSNDVSKMLLNLTIFSLFQLLSAMSDTKDALLCRQCGHEVLQAVHMNTIPSKLSKRQRNDTILGVPEVLIQLFQNPNGDNFEVITAEKADVLKSDTSVPLYSWFPGYLWRVALCPKCGVHLGWTYEPRDHKEGKKDTHRTFVGLIFHRLLHKNYADSLLVTPKAYRS